MQKQIHKKLLLSILVMLWAALFGAENAEAQKAKKMKIELGETFRNDQVKVFLNKDLVYDKRTTTADSASIADLFYVNRPKGPYTVTVEINGQKFEKSSPKQKKELDDENYSLLINYNRDSAEVELKTHSLIILYD
ncbi:hypothetical protein I5M27_00950 [Adhaeribacter sp. BT258]|uniref:DUF2141 domain-containing protein n=1 Tax=Adhaeribacter terrigena TaxID=2793070 RepID=A0ABS1BWT8_9BACT|nr:hypothetical protein [Adhaeribacter terrigena]MBK0401529.1 hypothetical protein [Adhaeribacter terrigena]